MHFFVYVFSFFVSSFFFAFVVLILYPVSVKITITKSEVNFTRTWMWQIEVRASLQRRMNYSGWFVPAAVAERCYWRCLCRWCWVGLLMMWTSEEHPACTRWDWRAAARLAHQNCLCPGFWHLLNLPHRQVCCLYYLVLLIVETMMSCWWLLEARSR